MSAYTRDPRDEAIVSTYSRDPRDESLILHIKMTMTRLIDSFHKEEINRSQSRYFDDDNDNASKEEEEEEEEEEEQHQEDILFESEFSAVKDADDDNAEKEIDEPFITQAFIRDDNNLHRVDEDECDSSDFKRSSLKEFTHGESVSEPTRICGVSAESSLIGGVSTIFENNRKRKSPSPHDSYIQTKRTRTGKDIQDDNSCAQDTCCDNRGTMWLIEYKTRRHNWLPALLIIHERGIDCITFAVAYNSKRTFKLDEVDAFIHTDIRAPRHESARELWTDHRCMHIVKHDTAMVCAISKKLMSVERCFILSMVAKQYHSLSVLLNEYPKETSALIYITKRAAQSIVASTITLPANIKDKEVMLHSMIDNYFSQGWRSKREEFQHFEQCNNNINHITSSHYEDNIVQTSQHFLAVLQRRFGYFTLETFKPARVLHSLLSTPEGQTKWTRWHLRFFIHIGVPVWDYVKTDSIVWTTEVVHMSRSPFFNENKKLGRVICKSLQNLRIEILSVLSMISMPVAVVLPETIIVIITQYLPWWNCVGSNESAESILRHVNRLHYIQNQRIYSLSSSLH